MDDGVSDPLGIEARVELEDDHSSTSSTEEEEENSKDAMAIFVKFMKTVGYKFTGEDKNAQICQVQFIFLFFLFFSCYPPNL